MMYQIYDGMETSLLADYPEIEATTARKALEKYLVDSNRSTMKFKRSGGYHVTFKTTPFEVKDGQKYRAGRDCWWKITQR